LYNEANFTLYSNQGQASNNHQLQTPAGTITANAWQHIAVTYNRTTGIGTLYVNALRGNAKSRHICSQTTFELNIGKRVAPVTGSGNVYSGVLDEISVYNRALSGSEVKAISSAGSAGKYDHALTAPQNLAEMQVIFNGHQCILGSNTSWQTTPLLTWPPMAVPHPI